MLSGDNFIQTSTEETPLGEALFVMCTSQLLKVWNSPLLVSAVLDFHVILVTTHRISFVAVLSLSLVQGRSVEALHDARLLLRCLILS